MATEEPEENYHFTFHKSPEGLRYSVWRDLNKNDLYGTYDALITKPGAQPPLIFSVHIDASPKTSSLELVTDKKSIQKQFSHPEKAIAFIDNYAKRHGLVNFEKPESDRQYLSLGV